jgi:glutamyl-tRNA reductase
MSSSDGCQRTETQTEPAVVLTRLQRESTRIKRQEVDTAVRKLESSGELSRQEQEIIEEMANRIVTRLLEPSIAALDGRTDADSAELEALSRLFEPGTNQDGSE